MRELRGAIYTDQVMIALDLPDEAATARLAEALARRSGPGDVIALSGELGCGKTSFARAFIRARGRGDEEVPSPTFTLVQVYDEGAPSIWHFDLFRIEKPEEAFELGIEDAFLDAISLIEWPERLGALLPQSRLLLRLSFADRPHARRAEILASGRWEKRVGALAAAL